tara:strand:+ start:922 stop:1182 length:261 start_codon:yes stop_codon:yes gene_type:complete
MKWPPNRAWTSTKERGGYRHFAVKNFGGKGETRWVELSPLLRKDLNLCVPWSELKTAEEWRCGWLQLPGSEEEYSKGIGINEISHK